MWKRIKQKLKTINYKKQLMLKLIKTKNLKEFR
jgi:hypothetical protein